MTLIPADGALIVDTRNTNDLWCVFEHQVTFTEGEPPETILIGASRLHDVYRMVDGRTNSEWSRIFQNGGSVLVRIIALADNKIEAVRHAQEKVRDMDPKPRCNLHGYSLRHARRAIVCLNNNQRYNTQMEAALDLGIHASSISRHLAGELAHAQGLKFAWAPPEEGYVR